MVLHLCFACNTMLAGNMRFWKSLRLNDVTDLRCNGIETKRDKRPLVSSNHHYDFVQTLRRNISIAFFILISLDNMLYLETWSLSLRFSLFSFSLGRIYLEALSFNIVLNLILSSLGSRYLEEECLTSRFSLFCLPWVADTWKRNA